MQRKEADPEPAAVEGALVSSVRLVPCERCDSIESSWAYVNGGKELK